MAWRRSGRAGKTATILDRHIKAMDMIPEDSNLNSTIQLLSKNEDCASYKVKSSDGSSWYEVNLNFDEQDEHSGCPDPVFCEDQCPKCCTCIHFATCTCPDYEDKENLCKHIHLVKLSAHKLDNKALNAESGDNDADEDEENSSADDTDENNEEEEDVHRGIETMLKDLTAAVSKPNFRKKSSSELGKVLSHLKDARNLLSQGEEEPASASKKRKL